MPEGNTDMGFGTGGAAKPSGKNYLFIIAVDDYDPVRTPGFKALKNPIRDALAIINMLTTLYKFNAPDATHKSRKIAGDKYKDLTFPLIEYQENDVSTYCLFNENATITNIETHLEKLVADDNGIMTSDDNLIVLFSGHGSFNANKKRGKLVLYEEQMDFDDIYLYFNDYNAGQRCKHFLFILDCCFSGSIGYDNINTPDIADYSRRFLTSSNADEVSYDGGLHSPFAQGLLQALYEATTQSSLVLAGNIEKKVKRLSNKTQQVKYNYLGVDKSGDTHFQFELKNKYPPPEKFREKLLDLNYELAKFKAKRSHRKFNMICLCGDTLNSQKFVQQIMKKKSEQMKIFRDFNTKTQLIIGTRNEGYSDFWTGISKKLLKFDFNRNDQEGAKNEIATKFTQMLLGKDILVECIIDVVHNDQFIEMQKQIMEFLVLVKEKINDPEVIEDKADLQKMLFFVSNNITHKKYSHLTEVTEDEYMLIPLEPLDFDIEVEFDSWWPANKEDLLVDPSIQIIEGNIGKGHKSFESFVNALVSEFKVSKSCQEKLNKLLYE